MHAGYLRLGKKKYVLGSKQPATLKFHIFNTSKLSFSLSTDTLEIFFARLSFLATATVKPNNSLVFEHQWSHIYLPFFSDIIRERLSKVIRTLEFNERN